MSRSDVNLPLRRAILARDEYRCLHCESEDFLTIDHVVAEMWEGPTEASNLAVCCGFCSVIKGVVPDDLHALHRERLGKGNAKEIDADMGGAFGLDAARFGVTVHVGRQDRQPLTDADTATIRAALARESIAAE